MQGKLHEDNEMAIMGLTPARKVLAVFIWSKKTQQSNTIIVGHMYSTTLWLQASVFFLHSTRALVSIWSFFKVCVFLCVQKVLERVHLSFFICTDTKRGPAL